MQQFHGAGGIERGVRGHRRRLCRQQRQQRPHSLATGINRATNRTVQSLRARECTNGQRFVQRAVNQRVKVRY